MRRWIMQQLARRIVLVPEGTFTPSPPPVLLDSLTDELLVVASDVIKAVVTEAQAPPSGKAQLRMLAWLVADARGARVMLGKADADVAGKRGRRGRLAEARGGLEHEETGLGRAS